jgi:autotransporter-associated beta strand protein
MRLFLLFGTSVVAVLQLTAPAHAVITHRYSFSGNANDSVGSANWTVNGAAFNAGQVVFDGVNDFLSMATTPLPTGAGQSATIEVWGTYNPASAPGGRIFDFSNSGNTYLYVTPNATPATPSTTPVALSNTRFRYDDGLGEIGPMVAGTANNGQEVLFTTVLDFTGNLMSLYRDGGLIATAPMANVDILQTLAAANSYRLGSGTSMPPGGDLPAFLNGSINEFRIYNNVQSPTQILNAAIAGPDNPTVALTDKTWNAGAADWNTGGNWTAAGVPAGTNRAVVGNAGTASVSAASPTVGGIRINNGTLTIGSGGSLEATFPIELTTGDANTATINVNSGGRLTTSGILSDAGTGAKTININGGTVRAGFKNSTVAAGSTTVVGASGATIDTQANNLTWMSTLSGSGNITKTGPGTLNLVSSSAVRLEQSANFTGELTINEGTVTVGTTMRVFGVGGPKGGGILNINNANLIINCDADKFLDPDLRLSGDVKIDNVVGRAGREVIMRGSISGTGTLRIDHSVFAEPLGVDLMDLPNTVDPTMPFLADNSGYRGRVIFDAVTALRIRAAGADFPNAVVELTNPGAWAGKRGSDPNQTIQLGGIAGIAGSRFEASIAGGGDPLADVTYELGGASQDAEFFGIVQDTNATDSVTVVKVGANVQALNGPNTYSGTTTINGGRLLVNGTHAMSATTSLPVGDYTVNSGGTLGGTGTIGSTADPVNVNVVGGTLAPGAGTGTLTINGNYTQNASARLAIELAGTAPGSFDVLAVNGAANLAGSLDIDRVGSFNPSNDNSFTVLTASSITGNLSLTGESAGFTLQVNPTSLVLNFSAVGVPGDYNNNGTVDAADYVLWRKGGPLMNDPTPGLQAADYDFWRSRFGAIAGSGSGIAASASAVPEPAAVVLVLLGLTWFGLGWRQNRT